MPALTVRRLLAVGALVLLMPVVACNEEDDDARSSKDPATRATQSPTTDEVPDPTEAPSTETGDASLPLSENAPSTSTPPLWAFPAFVDGWEWATRDQNGLNQLQRNDGDVLFTSYQLLEEDTMGKDDATDSRAWLDKYVNEMTNNPQVVDVASPTYSTTEVDSDRGSIEFVVQDVTYETEAGTTYRSRFLARSLGPNMLAVQYAAPVEEWSEDEWAELTGSGLMVTLGS